MLDHQETSSKVPEDPHPPDCDDTCPPCEDPHRPLGDGGDLETDGGASAEDVIDEEEEVEIESAEEASEMTHNLMESNVDTGKLDTDVPDTGKSTLI